MRVRVAKNAVHAWVDLLWGHHKTDATSAQYNSNNAGRIREIIKQSASTLRYQIKVHSVLLLIKAILITNNWHKIYSMGPYTQYKTKDP